MQGFSFYMDFDKVIIWGYTDTNSKGALDMIKSFVKWLRNQYVANQVQQASIPDFPPDEVCRYRAIFYGRVQHVGFRMETALLARQLDLTGFCRNQEDGSVFAELQGPENRILFLISFLESLTRIQIHEKILTRIPLCANETGFDYQSSELH